MLQPNTRSEIFDVIKQLVENLDAENKETIHLNITSLTKHIEQLRFYLYDKPFDIFSINEIVVYNSIDDRAIQLEGYNVIRKDRSREGGGVAIYYRDHLNVKERNDLIPAEIEAICIEIFKPKSKPILVTTEYSI